MNGRRARERRRAEQPLEAAIVSPHPEAVRAALDAISPDLSWDDCRDGLRPVFIRRRPLPPGMAPPVTRRLPVGVNVSLGVDIGPAFMYVGGPLLESWGVTADDAFATAMANLRSVIDQERYFEMAYEPVDDIPLWWYQSRGGLASGLLLLDDTLVQRFGDEPRVLMAPMRNLLLAAPHDADREVLEWLRDEISHADPNGLDLPLFSLVNGRLSIEPSSMPAQRAIVH